MRFRRLRPVLLLIAAGCGPDNPRREVVGAVTLAGAPLADGTITFESESTSPHCAEGSMIAGGKYHIPGKTGLLPGKYRVSISAPDRQPDPNAEPGSQRGPRELVPAKYNAKSTLTAEVGDADPATIDFDLKP